jgi:hypothetical protein
VPWKATSGEPCLAGAAILKKKTRVCHKLPHEACVIIDLVNALWKVYLMLAFNYLLLKRI